MNKKILMSGISIITALALVGGGAFALFSSSATNVGNTFGAGNMSLVLSSLAGPNSTPFFTFTGVAPGDVKTQVITLTNNGSIPSTSTKLVNIGHSGSVPDLGDKLTLELWDDANGNSAIDGGDTLRGIAHITNPIWSNIDMGFGLAASGSHKVIARVTFDSSSDDTYQGKSSSFDLAFQTNQ